MNVRTLCLAILNTGESTGYEIRKLSTDGHYSYFVDASFGSIYPALNRLETDGLVTSREELQSGKPSKKVFSITTAGQVEFLASLKKPIQKDIFKSEFMLIAMFAEFLTLADLNAAIDAQISNLRTDLSQIEGAEENTDLEGAHWVAEMGRNCLVQSIQYIENNRAELEALAGKKLPAESPAIAAE